MRRGSAASLRLGLFTVRLVKVGSIRWGLFTVRRFCLAYKVLGGLRSERVIGHMHVAGFTVNSCGRET